MDLSSPIDSVVPSVRGAVLAVLARTDVPLSGRGTAELTGSRAGYRQVNAVLHQLVDAGIVTREHHPPAYLYRLNRVHLAAPAIVALATLRERLFECMRDLVAAWNPAAAAVWLFGSAARGAGDTQSDIDVLVLRPDTVQGDNSVWLGQLDDLSRQVSAWTGNGCEVLEYSEAEFAALVAGDERLVAELRSDAVRIAGDSVAQRVRSLRRP